MSDAITLWLDGAMRCVLVFPPNHDELAVQLLEGDRATITRSCIDPDAAVLIAQQLWVTYVEGATRAPESQPRRGLQLLRPRRVARQSAQRS
jgi:hypothetical protein